MTDGGARLAERFQAHRPRLRAVAYRLLGSASEADDAVQEAWERVSRAGADGVKDLKAWLTHDRRPGLPQPAPFADGPKALERLRRALAACGLSFARRG